jgi:UDP-3-O-[3-hydroxymyristoyl] glucosamine N-acyltransferase
MAIKKSFTIGEIADILKADVKGNKDLKISKLNRIDTASAGELTFFSDEKFHDAFINSKATCIIVDKNNDVEPKSDQAFIIVESPYLSFVELIKYIDSQKKKLSSYIDDTAKIADSATIHPTAFIGPYCVIGENCRIGKDTILKSNVNLCDNVTIGDNALCHPNVVLCEDVVVGNNCILQPGAVIGSDGFGYTENKDSSYSKIPQIGNVVLEDDVEIGANTTIDRAIVGSTIIEKGTKIDNLVQIAHNVIVGENTGIAAQVGVSGSTIVGKRNRLAGQVGISGHIYTADDVTVLAQSGLSKSLTKSGYYFGSPARERLKAMKIEAVLRNLPELDKEIQKIKKELKSDK